MSEDKLTLTDKGDEPGSIIDRATVEKLMAEPDKGPLAPLAQVGDEEDEQPEDAPPAADPATPEPEATPEGEPPVEAEPAADPSTSDVLAQVNAQLEEIAQALREPEAAPEEPAAPQIPDQVKYLLEHEDPAVQAIGKQMLEQQQDNESRLDAVETQLHAASVARAADLMQQQIDTVSAACNPPLTAKEQQAVVDYLVAETDGSPALARALGPNPFEKGVRLLYPERVRVAKGAPKVTTPQNGAEGAGRPVIPVKPGPAKPAPEGTLPSPAPAAVRRPPEFENLEQAVSTGWDALTRGRG